MNKKKCIYCNQEKELEEFSLEHIFPDALGGSTFSDVFKTRNVCKRCNSISGLFIDGLFIKNFFTQNDSAEAYLNYVNLSNPTALPLKYTGILKNFKESNNKICEVWFGSHGGIVYHVRQKSDSRYDTMIGGNPIDRKKDKGCIFVFAQNSNSYWNNVLLLSCEKYFKKCRKISGNIDLAISTDPDSKNQNNTYFAQPSEEESKYQSFFSSIQGQEHQLNLPIQIDFDQRFLSKLALGLGHNLFGDIFLDTEHCQKLRNAMWAKELQKRVEILEFPSYFDQNLTESLQFLVWEGVHTFLFLPIENTVYLIFFCFGSKLLRIPLCDDKRIWESVIPPEGRIYIGVPQLDIFSKPLNVAEVIEHKTGVRKQKVLEEIDKARIDISQLPKITES